MNMPFQRLALSLALLGACLSMPTAFAADRTTSPRPVLPAEGPTLPNRYIVVLKEGGNPRSVAAIAGIQPTHLYTSALNGFAAELNAGQLNALRHNPNVDYIEHDAPVTLDATQTMDALGDPWGLDRIDQRNRPLSRTYTYTATGSGVTAYIIDTGLQANHPDFGGRAQNVFDVFGGTGDDCDGHGTHVAGTIGGATYGVAKQVQLRGVRVFSCDEDSEWSDIIAGVDWVRANAQKPAVANMSLGGGKLTAVNTAVANLSNSGVFVAVAAGNNATTSACNQSPASTPEAYTVAASDKTDAKASFSSTGSCVDIYAPGVAIKSASINSSTDTMSGTSMAAPHVAGAAALYKSVYGDVSSATVSTWLSNNATPNVISGNPTGTPNRLLYVPALIAPTVSAGGYHNCAIRTDQSIACWGENYDGQIIAPTGTFTEVSAGTAHNCAIRTDQSVTCWGYNGLGQSTPPTGTFSQLSAGGHHTCGFRTDGSLACWGGNGVGMNYGQAIPLAGTFTQVSAGFFHTCAVRTDQTVACWGQTEYGQSTPPAGTFKEVSAGRYHTCGLRTDGSLACWGGNQYGQSTPPTGTFTQLSTNFRHNCAIRTDGSLACWGYNSDGQSTPPTGTFTHLSTGGYHACARRTNGSLACWGNNVFGQGSPLAAWY
ncbi:MAG TPA: S8 family serine peptidase [Herpetosiphonaceae bacterium]